MMESFNLNAFDFYAISPALDYISLSQTEKLASREREVSRHH